MTTLCTVVKNLFYTKQSHKLTHLFFIHLGLSSFCEASTGFISVASRVEGVDSITTTEKGDVVVTIFCS
jgi:hypothetical protein